MQVFSELNNNKNSILKTLLRYEMSLFKEIPAEGEKGYILSALGIRMMLKIKEKSRLQNNQLFDCALIKRSEISEIINELKKSAVESDRLIRKQFIIELGGTNSNSLHYVALDLEIDSNGFSKCFFLDASNDQSYFGGMLRSLENAGFDKIYFAEFIELSFTYKKPLMISEPNKIYMYFCSEENHWLASYAGWNKRIEGTVELFDVEGMEVLPKNEDDFKSYIIPSELEKRVTQKVCQEILGYEQNMACYITKLQKDYYNCPTFSFDHAAKMSNEPELYSMLEMISNSDGSIPWDKLPARFIWNIQSLSQPKNLADQLEKEGKDERAKILRSHLEQTSKAYNGRSINDAIYIKKLKYQYRVHQMIDNSSESELAKILFPGDEGRNDLIRVLMHELFIRKAQISEGELDDWMIFLPEAGCAAISQMLNNVHFLDNQTVSTYLESGDLLLLDVLNAKDNLVSSLENENVIALLEAGAISYQTVTILPLSNIDRLENPGLREAVLSGTVDILDVLLISRSKFDPEKEFFGLDYGVRDIPYPEDSSSEDDYGLSFFEGDSFSEEEECLDETNRSRFEDV